MVADVSRTLRPESGVPREMWAFGTSCAFLIAAAIIFFVGVPGKRRKSSLQQQMIYEKNICMVLVGCAVMAAVVVYFEGEKPLLAGLRWQHVVRSQIYDVLCGGWSRGRELVWQGLVAVGSALSSLIEQSTAAAVDTFCQVWSGRTEGEANAACQRRSYFGLSALSCSTFAITVVGLWIKYLGRPRAPRGIIKMPHIDKLSQIAENWGKNSDPADNGSHRNGVKGMKGKKGGKGGKDDSGTGRGARSEDGGNDSHSNEHFHRSRAGTPRNEGALNGGSRLLNRLNAVREKRKADKPAVRMASSEAQMQAQMLQHKALHGTAEEKEALRTLGLI